jgi:hypothetical protein
MTIYRWGSDGMLDKLVNVFKEAQDMLFLKQTDRNDGKGSQGTVIDIRECTVCYVLTKAEHLHGTICWRCWREQTGVGR